MVEKIRIDVTQRDFGPGTVTLRPGDGKPGIREVGPGEEILWKSDSAGECWLRNAQRMGAIVFEVDP